MVVGGDVTGGDVTWGDVTGGWVIGGAVAGGAVAAGAGGTVTPEFCGVTERPVAGGMVEVEEDGGGALVVEVDGGGDAEAVTTNQVPATPCPMVSPGFLSSMNR
jgi:hypothetical protein